jgi:CHASE3 domain sensor protein
LIIRTPVGIQALTAESDARRRELRKRVRFTASALAFSLLALACAAYLLARHSLLVRQVGAQLNGLAGWSQQLRSIDNCLTSAESAERSYVLTAQDSYLQAYRAELQRLPELLSKLDALPLKERSSIESMSDIRLLANARLEEFTRTLQIYEHAGREAAVEFVRRSASQQSMQQLRSDIDQLSSTIRSQRHQSDLDTAAGIAEIQNLAIITVAALFVSVLLVGLQIKPLLSAHARYEEALANSETRHRAIVEDQTELIALSRADGSLKYINPAYARFFQISSEAVADINFCNFILKDDVKAAQRQLS